jgi:hypothetical protein
MPNNKEKAKAGKGRGQDKDTKKEPMSQNETEDLEAHQAEVAARNYLLKSDTIRLYRNRLLDKSDWIMQRAIDLGWLPSISWNLYRQALRDITEQPGFPDNIVWPNQPPVPAADQPEDPADPDVNPPPTA